MQFKELELKPKGNFLQRSWRSAHFRKSLLAVGIGAVLGFLFFYFTEGQHMDSMSGGEILKSMAVGAFFGLFMTNSPCARGRC
jgi:hypothetical protein